MALNVPGLVVVVILYVLIVVVGILAARWVRPKADATKTEMNLVAGRDLSLVIGIFTMTATSVGGGYLSGTTEGVAQSGLLWTVYPFTIVIAFTIGSCFFAKPMRERRYLTLLDPLQERFGDVMTGLLLFGALFAELIWGASILISLGTSLSIIIDIGIDSSIVLSAGVALLYTCFGAAVSVAYTDVVQLCLVAFGMILCVPFAMTNQNAGNFGASSATWLGTLDLESTATWIDYVISQVLGGIPWNTYMMRILAARSVRDAQVVSVAGGLLGWAMAIPPALLGIVGVSADWNATSLGESPLPDNAASLMPLVIQHFTPKVVSIIALAAIVAAVMSSLDSIILSSSSMFTHNIYRLSFRKQAGDGELRAVQLAAMVVVTAVCALIAVMSSTVYGIFILTADIVYVILFPQFVCAVFLRFTNSYGSFLGLVVGAVLRFGGGEPSLSLAPFIKYPFYDEVREVQRFPFKSFAMLCTLATILAVSVIVRYLFDRNYIPARMDVSRKVVQRYALSGLGMGACSAHVAEVPAGGVTLDVLKYTRTAEQAACSQSQSQSVSQSVSQSHSRSQGNDGFVDSSTSVNKPSDNQRHSVNTVLL